MKLSDLTNNTATLTVPVGDGAIEVTYRPASLTEQTLAQLDSLGTGLQHASALGDVTASVGTLGSLLTTLVARWSLYEDDAETVMVPLTPERLAQLPMMLLATVLGAIVRDGQLLGEVTRTGTA